MNLTDLKSTISTAPDEELIRMAGEMLGRKVLFEPELYNSPYYIGDETFRFWNPLESETDAFELVDFLTSKGFWSTLSSSNDISNGVIWFFVFYKVKPFEAYDKSRCRAIVKASILVWNYWKEMGK
jgi:hypothetical protein